MDTTDTRISEIFLFFISKIFYIFPVPLLGDGLDGLDLVILSVLVPLNGLSAPLRCSSAFDLKESMLIELKHMFLGQGKGQIITILTSLSLIFQREIISHELSRF